MNKQNARDAQLDTPARLPKKKLPPLIDIALPLVAVSSGLMLGMAVPNIIETSGFWTSAKAAVLAGSAMVVSLGVNKLAIERGAAQATKGFVGATIVSLGSIIVVGAGLFAATYSGLVFDDVAELQLQEHGVVVAAEVGAHTAASIQIARVLPAIRAIESDLQRKLACEIDSACISGHGGGYGPVARIVEEQAGLAAAIASQVAAGDASRQAVVERLSGLLVQYQSTLGNSGEDVWARRAALRTIDARIRQELGELGEAIPVALMSAFASSLQGGIAIPGRAEAETRLNANLSRHGQTLSSVIASIGSVDSETVPFPRRTGVSDTFDYISHFLPVAAITAVVELIFPLVLWAYTFWALSWEGFLRDRRSESGTTIAEAERRDGKPDASAEPSHRSRLNGHDRRGHDPRRRGNGNRQSPSSTSNPTKET